MPHIPAAADTTANPCTAEKGVGKEGILVENIWFPWISLVSTKAVLSALPVMKSSYSNSIHIELLLLVMISERGSLNNYNHVL